MTEPRYPYVSIDVAEADADEAGALLFELGAGGVEQRDATTLAKGAAGGAGRVTLVASFEGLEEARAAASDLPAGWSPRVEEVVGDAWRDEWKRYFEPFRLCGSLVVRPPWREYEPAPGERVLVLEPGRAFGTGLHETTSLVAGALAGLDLAGARVLDVGCGSGILALAALALGASSARAIDVDPEAVSVTRENADRNGLGSAIEADGADVGRLAGEYPVVLANIEYRTLVDLAPALAARTTRRGLLVLSGILAPSVAPAQLEAIRHAYLALGFRELRVDSKGEWVVVVLARDGAVEG
jgi:ribosomal protein L11 methyltransferase